MTGHSKPVSPAAFDDCPVSIPCTKGPQTRFGRVCPVSSRGELEEKSDRQRFFFSPRCNSYRARFTKLTQRDPPSWGVGFAAPESQRASQAGGLLSKVQLTQS